MSTTVALVAISLSFAMGIAYVSLGLIPQLRTAERDDQVSYSHYYELAAAPIFESVKAVVSLASQTYGVQYVSLVSPRPILLVHGEDDTRLGPERSKLIYDTAKEPKQLVLYPGASHSLVECRDQLHPLLRSWLLDKLNDGVQAEPGGVKPGRQ